MISYSQLIKKTSTYDSILTSLSYVHINPEIISRFYFLLLSFYSVIKLPFSTLAELYHHLYCLCLKYYAVNIEISVCD